MSSQESHSDEFSVLVKSDKTLGQKEAEREVALMLKKAAGERAENKPIPRIVPSRRYLELVLEIASLTAPEISMEDVKGAWQMIEPETIRRFYAGLRETATAVRDEYRKQRLRSRATDEQTSTQAQPTTTTLSDPKAAPNGSSRKRKAASTEAITQAQQQSGALEDPAREDLPKKPAMQNSKKVRAAAAAAAHHKIMTRSKSADVDGTREAVPQAANNPLESPLKDKASGVRTRAQAKGK